MGGLQALLPRPGGVFVQLGQHRAALAERGVHLVDTAVATTRAVAEVGELLGQARGSWCDDRVLSG